MESSMYQGVSVGVLQICKVLCIVYNYTDKASANKSHFQSTRSVKTSLPEPTLLIFFLGKVLIHVCKAA